MIPRDNRPMNWELWSLRARLAIVKRALRREVPHAEILEALELAEGRDAKWDAKPKSTASRTGKASRRT